MARPRITSAAEAIAAILPGSTVYLAGGPGHPSLLAEELAVQGPRLAPLTVVTSLMGELPPYARSGAAAWCRVKSFRGMAGAREALAAGQVDVVPVNLSAIPDLLARQPLRPRVAIVQCAPPAAGDRTDDLSLGVSVLYHLAAVAAAEIVIAEVNPDMPWTCGTGRVPLSEVTHLVEARHPVPEGPQPQSSEAERAVARRVAGLIPDGSVVQVGMGGVGDAVLEALRGRRGIRLHAGLLGDGIVDLAEAGALAPGPGAIVTAALYGTRRLYDFASRNLAVEVHPVTRTHDPSVLRGLARLVAVNSAVEVDLTGQVNAESVGGLPVSGAGGQLDFVRGAAEAGGRSIIALPATAARGTRSRIVARLSDGVVTTPRTEADLVATEFGVAELRGRTLGERAEALAAVADPRFRDELLAATRGAERTGR